ncbi:uncharacterized protein C8Q71DRAFT_854794 [Rhodofomes roseus]|uniref:Uncharacterized protein n=1 Tax=Rhodofomes roseus TaxID=34475 RepID=A0ABQ8KQT6_9APHY|nr:uncharacterized protein C8Q71DRAFT_854794 [Rhodofomes roseus]KAH9840946.1 hypothetical protein C8Q71DRAFT_854794 [Rhodofomes roseus]
MAFPEGSIPKHGPAIMVPNLWKVAGMPLIDKFHEDPDIFLVIFDPNWNPAHDLQAIDRAYRFGQTRDVEVFRLLGAGSIEELIYARQVNKQQQMQHESRIYQPDGDYTSYYTPDVPAWKVFTYTYLGLNVPIILLQCLGASFAVAASTVPAWNNGYNNGNFGKFLTVMLALSATGNIAITLYSFCVSFQVFIPQAMYVPRYFFSVLAIAIIIPLSIVGQHKFYDALSNFLGLIGYWSTAFCAVVINDYRRLPLGLAAIGACLLACSLIVPSMDQVWFVGPFAKTTGDIAFELAFVATALFYVPLRLVELRLRILLAAFELVEQQKGSKSTRKIRRDVKEIKKLRDQMDRKLKD